MRRAGSRREVAVGHDKAAVEVAATAWRAWLPTIPVMLLGGVYAAVATLFTPFTWPMRVVTTLACIGVVVIAVRHGWFRRGQVQSRPSVAGGSPIAYGAWLALLAVLAFVQLSMYFSHPRDAYPTLSSLSSIAFEVPGVRIAGFAFWLWVGWYLVRR